MLNGSPNTKSNKYHTALIVGGDSQLAKTLLPRLSAANYQVSVTTRRRSDDDLYLDLSKKESIRNIAHLIASFDLLIICASMCNVAYCEQNPNESELVNVDNTKLIIDIAAERKIPVVFISTDIVSDLNKDKQPKTRYAKQKLDIELYIKTRLVNYLIIRPGKIVFDSIEVFERALQEILQDNHVSLFKDHHLAPVCADYLVEQLVKLIEQKRTGVFFIIGERYLSYFELFAENIKELEALKLILKKHLDLIHPEYANNKSIQPTSNLTSVIQQKIRPKNIVIQPFDLLLEKLVIKLACSAELIANHEREKTLFESENIKVKGY